MLATQRFQSRSRVVGQTLNAWGLAALCFTFGTLFSTPVRAKDLLTAKRTVVLPGDGGDPITSFPDGRLLCVTPDARVHVETIAGSGIFEFAATLPDANFSSFGASFTRLSPDGKWLAIGNSGGETFSRYEIGVFRTQNYTGRWLGRLPPGQSGGLLHYAAAWIDNRNLALTGGRFGIPSFVDVLDTQSPNTVDPQRTRVVERIGGASAGIAFDAGGNLVTGNGYKGDGPSGTGSVHAIAAQDWRGALNGSRGAVNFETQSTPIIQTLSAAGIAFDRRGNLWIGGKDVFGPRPIVEQDFMAVVDAKAYQAVLAGGPAISGSSDAVKVTRLDPEPTKEGQTFFAYLVPATGEVLVRDINANLAFGYTPTASPMSAPVMPTPLAWAMGLGLLGLAWTMGRRQTRHPARVYG